MVNDNKNTSEPSATGQTGAVAAKAEDGIRVTGDSKKETPEKQKQRNPTVTFNVGGTKYEISQTLLLIHPYSLLSEEADKQRRKDKPEDPIFIDRDGGRFKYVLDWMRDNQVVIPVTVSKKALLNELRYFGFDNVDESTIRH